MHMNFYGLMALQLDAGWDRNGMVDSKALATNIDRGRTYVQGLEISPSMLRFIMRISI